MKKTKEEVKLAKKGTIMADFQKERTNAISEMFDNEGKDGIFPTSEFFIRLDKAVKIALDAQKRKIKKDLIKIADQGEYEDLRREVEDYIPNE